MIMSRRSYERGVLRGSPLNHATNVQILLYTYTADKGSICNIYIYIQICIYIYMCFYLQIHMTHTHIYSTMVQSSWCMHMCVDVCIPCTEHVDISWLYTYTQVCMQHVNTHTYMYQRSTHIYINMHTIHMTDRRPLHIMCRHGYEHMHIYIYIDTYIYIHIHTVYT